MPEKVRDSFCNMSDIEESDYQNLSVLLLYVTTTHYLYYQLLQVPTILNEARYTPT